MRGVAYGTKLAYDQMVRQGGGQIVTTASVAGLVPVPLQAHYCATKHALVGLHNTLELEAVQHGIDLTLFCPAFVQSGMFTNNTMRGTLEGTDARKLVPIKPLATDKAVRRLLSGVAAKKRLVVTPFYGRMGWWLERLSPAIRGGCTGRRCARRGVARPSRAERRARRSSGKVSKWRFNKYVI